jgi:biopolymer transport protein ExbB/TolQ
MAGLKTLLFVVSESLFYPVIIGLVLLIAWTALSFGGFVREALERRRGLYRAPLLFGRALDIELSSTGSHDLINARCERLIQEHELSLVRSADGVKFIIRVGPALGLMGTLIPMGTALSALAQGDMPRMAGDMVTAFTTTVVGLACGVVAYLMALVMERWIRADMREMEFQAEVSILHRASAPIELDEERP